MLRYEQYLFGHVRQLDDRSLQLRLVRPTVRRHLQPYGMHGKRGMRRALDAMLSRMQWGTFVLQIKQRLRSDLR